MKEFENELYESGIKYIAGIDEVGRGPLVGPVVTAAVILPKDFYDERINDSKKLTEEKINKTTKMLMIKYLCDRVEYEEIIE